MTAVIRRFRRAWRRGSSRVRRTALTPFLRIEHDPSLVRLGTRSNGWWVPGDVTVPGTVAYCAGAGEDISFDLALHQRGVECVTIDPTPRAIAHVRTVHPGGDRFTFVPVGLWTERTTLRFYAPSVASEVSHSVVNLQRTASSESFTAEVDTLASIMAAVGHDHVDLLKVDIEGAEPAVLRQLLDDGPRPAVVCFEYDQPQSSRALLVLLRQFRRHGYRLVRRERWNFTLRRDPEVVPAPPTDGRHRTGRSRAGT